MGPTEVLYRMHVSFGLSEILTGSLDVNLAAVHVRSVCRGLMGFRFQGQQLQNSAPD